MVAERLVEQYGSEWIPYQVRDDKGNSLKNAGYDSSLEMKGLLHRTHEASFDQALTGTEMNIRSYIREYPMKGLVLPNLIDIKEIRGSKRLVNSYSGLPINEMITARERNGAVLEASIKAEQFLATQNGGMVVITSPMGWTGLGFDYLSSQTIVFQKERSGQLIGVTLVSDMTREQNKRLLIELGVDSAKLVGKDDKEEIANIVRNPAILSKWTIHDTVNKILSIRGYEDIRLQKQDGSVEIRPVKALLEDIKRLPQLLKFNPVIESYIGDFKAFVLVNALSLENEFTLRRIQQEMEKTILRITREVMGGESLQSSVFSLQTTENGFNRELIYLKSLPGCAGGGSIPTDLGILRGGSMAVSMGIGLDSEVGKCLICGEINTCTKKCHACGGNLIS